ncbi:MAG: DUF6089 family protein [Weeksellaceae bacterium]
MKNYFTFLLVTFILFQLQAQKHEVGVFIGTTNGITDVGRTDYINPFPKDWGVGNPTIPINLGLLYKFNLNPHQSLRLNLHYTRFIDNDRLAAEDYRYDRGAKYSQTLYETSVLFEYNFFPINSEQERAHSPYIFAGLGAFGYKHPTYTVVNTISSKTNVEGNPTHVPVISKDDELKFSYSIPFGVGYKYKFNYNWEAGLELGVRPTFIDDLDMADATEEDFTFLNQEGLTNYVSQDVLDESNEKLIRQRQIGDRSNNDWYVFSGLTFTYIFGRPPCFCD